MRDLGSRESIVFSQTVDAGGERAGVAWYEIRDTGSGWQRHQDGIYAPSDGEYRWIPSIAMNTAGDIGMSFMRSSSTVFPSVSVVGQTAAEGAGASGLFDSSETTCAVGSIAMDQTYKRSGDYAATIVDPVSDRFWAIQQYAVEGVWADWGVWVCEFEVDGTPKPPVANFTASPTSGEAPLEVSFTDLSTQSPTSWSWDFGDTGTSTSQGPSHTYTAAGEYTVSLTATNDVDSDTETKTAYITVTEPAPIVDHLAQSLSIQEGTSSGALSNSFADDGATQTITEEESNGNPAKRRSSAQATWAFSVRNGKPATFYLNAWQPPSSDGDTFEFSYSTDNSNYVTMFEVSEQSDTGTYQSFVLGVTPSSQMWIRVEDTNNDQGANSLDDLFVDHMFIRTEGSVPPAPDAITDLNATSAGFDAISLSWTDVSTEVGYSVERKSGGGSYSEVVLLAADESSYLDEGLNPATIYTYRVGPFNAGGTTWSNEASAETAEPPPGQAVHVAGMSGSGTDKKRWVATVVVDIENQLGSPESSVLVSGSWSNGETGQANCTTDGSGQCSVEIGTKSPSVMFTVTDLAKSGFTYDDSADFASPPAITVNQGQVSGAVLAKSGAEIPDVLSLEQNYPNPFNPVTILSYGLPAAQDVTVSVFNALGIEVARLHDGSQEAGWHRVAFDGTDLSSGLYVAVVRAGGVMKSKTMLLAK
jgi:PKD repeat protein